MKKILKIVVIVGIIIMAYVCGVITTKNTIGNIEKPITVNNVVELIGTDYFIVKDINSWSVLESNMYMDRKVVEINICDDTEDTLCLFIELDKNEKSYIRKVY